MTASARLTELGLTLPEVPKPLAAYVPATRSGSQVLTAGQLPFVDGALTVTGAVGGAVTQEQAYEAARTAGLNAIAAAASVAGGVDAITRVVRVCVFVASTPDFTAHPAVANGASELMVEVFGEAGKHVRSAVGVSSLPMGSPVEVELVVEL